jgi:hypothetical protein
MEVDYSPFLNGVQDGSIWWPLADAVKLGAGYLPVRDDNRDPIPVLRAQNHLVVADARTLLSEFGGDHYTDAHPRLLERDDGRYVEAHEFLSWLAQYLATQPQSTIQFPNELARAVKKATGARGKPSSPPSGFESLTIALEGWFDKPLADLTETLRRRVKDEFLPLPWDHLTPEQRRSGALQRDYQRDPATEEDRKFWWDFYVRLEGLKEQIEHWSRVKTPTAGDLALRETRLADLRQTLARMELRQRQARGDYYPKGPSARGAIASSTPKRTDFPYIAYPKAMSQLVKRLDATSEELAAWLFCGPEQGGIAAYVNANELDPPPRFFFPIGTEDFEYVPYLMACWFKRDDIEQFAPADRYITGQALVDRWSGRAGLQPTAYIRAKIAESRLMEMHPLYGLTQGSCPENKDFPPLTSGLFALSQVQQIEDEDFAEDDRSGRPSESKRPEIQASKPRPEVDGTPAAPDPAPTSVRHAVRKLESQDLYKRWRSAYRQSRKNHPDKSDVWHSQQIAKLKIANGRKADTIRKHMTP